MKNGRQAKRKTRRANSRPEFYLAPERQEEIAAVTLLGIAVLTALGAFNLSRGNVLDSWTDVLSILFGWGRVIAPFFFGGLGVWLLLDSLDLRPDIGWERPFGFALLFLILLTSMHITLTGARGFAAAQHGEGGGLIGYALSDSMVAAIGVPGTFLILIFACFIALIMLFNVPLARIFSVSVEAVRSLGTFIGNSFNAWSKRTTPVAGLSRTKPGRPSPLERPVKPTQVDEKRPAFSEPTTSRTGTLAQRPAVAARIVGGQTQAPMVHREWRLPNLQEILEESVEQEISAHEVRTKVHQIEETLNHFGVPAKVVEVNQGPTITQFGVEPGFLEQKAPDGSLRRTKVKVSRISALQHDLELALAAAPVRVEAPVPGKSIVGIEVPNSQISLVSLRGAMESEEFAKLSKSKLAIALGQDVSGQPIVADLGSMPHLLIAGATGSGKSVCVNSLIACLLITNTPDDLAFVMVDPKRVELSAFNGVPHLITPVVVDMSLAVAALERAVSEMDRRFKMFANVGARNIESYRQIVADKPEKERLPYLVLVVDELADLMLVARDEVEKAITRLAQMARATGIHLVLATQRPSVDVVTGLIKANFPSRISFAVTSQTDSRVVLDTPGAEDLLGRGDMLYMASDSSKLLRLQGCFVSDQELDRLVGHWKGFVEYPAGSVPGSARSPDDLTLVQATPSSIVGPRGQDSSWVQGGLWNDLQAAHRAKSDEDELLDQAIGLVRASERASISLLQRKLRIGYSRAAKLMDLLEQKGYVGPEEGAPGKGREVLLKGDVPRSTSMREFENVDDLTASALPVDDPAKGSSHGDGRADTSFDDWTDEDWADLDKD